MMHDWQPIKDMDGMKCACCGDARHAETQWPPDDEDNQCNGCASYFCRGVCARRSTNDRGAE